MTVFQRPQLPTRSTARTRNSYVWPRVHDVDERRRRRHAVAQPLAAGDPSLDLVVAQARGQDLELDVGAGPVERRPSSGRAQDLLDGCRERGPGRGTVRTLDVDAGPVALAGRSRRRHRRRRSCSWPTAGSPCAGRSGSTATPRRLAEDDQVGRAVPGDDLARAVPGDVVRRQDVEDVAAVRLIVTELIRGGHGLGPPMGDLREPAVEA